MSIYIYILVLLLVEILCVSVFNKKIVISCANKKNVITINLSGIFAFLDIVLMILIMGFRAKTVGTDTNIYLDLYNTFARHSFFENISIFNYQNLEYGYVMFNTIAGHFLNQHFFLLIVAIVIYTPILIFIIKKSKSPILSLFIFLCFGFFNQSFNISRQWIAIGILMISYNYVIKKKFWKFVLLVFCATLFHKTALVFAIIYPLSFIKYITKNMIIIYSALSSIFILFGSQITDVLQNIFYAGYELDRSGDIGLSIFINIVILLTLMYFKHSFQKNNEDANLLIIISALTILFNILGIYMDLFSRVMLYFKVFYIISIPNMVASIINDNTRHLLSISIIVLFSLFYLYSLFTSTMFDTLPFIFS